MRKLLLLCFLCFTWIARGQDEYRWHYWFDANYDAGVSGTTQSRLFTIDADASSLDFGAHTFNFQVEDKDGISSSPVSKYFYYSNSTIDKLTYWFDNDTKNMKEESGMDGHFILDVSSIEPGVHFINLMLKDASGRISEIKQQCFYRVINKTATKLTYWFDDDESTKETIAFHDGTSMFDVSKLKEGFHTISIVTHDYTSSAIATRMFIKVPQTQGGDFDMVCLCSVDGKLVAQDRLPSTGGILNFNLDVNNIDPGLHKAIFQTITPTGAASNTVERYFIRTTTNNEIATMKCLYSIDDAKTYTQAGNFANGLFHFDLDVASLDDGLHRLAYMLIADNGVSTPMQSAFFWKTPVGGNAITQYDYWLNDNEANAKKVTLAERKNPFSLITLLPIESCPIRSSCFQFEVKDGKPMMYARNDIHFRFFDAAGRLAEITKQFIDYSISQEITDIAELQSTQTFARPAENTVKWFKTFLERGDSLVFDASQALTLQLFDATGMMIYEANGKDVVEGSGCRVPAKGDYYLAVHDVTSSAQRDIVLNVVKISKFDVLEYSSHDLGILPMTHILRIYGNGFENLKSITLQNGSEIIKADTVFVYNAGKADVFINLKGNESAANYSMNFVFDDGDDYMTITKTISLSKPNIGDIKVEISDPGLYANPYYVTVTVANKSNVTYMDVPLYFAYDAKNATLSCFKNFSVEAAKELVDSGLQLQYYIKNFKKTNKPAYIIPTMIPIILPGETMKFVLGFNVTSNVAFNVYSWIGTPWNMQVKETMSYLIDLAKGGYSSGVSHTGDGSTTGGGSNPGGNSGSDEGPNTGGGSNPGGGMIYLPGNSSGSSYFGNEGEGQVVSGCLDDDPCDLVGVLFEQLQECACATIFNLGSTLGNIQLALMAQNHRAQNAQLVANGQDPIYHDIRLRSPLDIIRNMAGHCIPGTLGRIVNLFNLHMDILGYDPCPNPNPHQNNPRNSCEPNDIRGYTSESGSTYMRNDVEEVTYIIDSENDPVFATAAAHTVIITDTINGEFYDLTSLSTRNITIGDVSMELDGTEQNFIKTMDLRPRINVVAQVEQKYDSKTGIAKWIWTSLDPMTMEPTDDVMQGVLPVNDETHIGEGHVTFKLKQKTGLPNGTDVTNQADIVFDSNEPVFTPVWTNTIDAIAPESTVASIDIKNDSTATVKVQATDNLSGVWKYDVYVRYGSEGSSWYKAVEGATTEDIDVKYYKDVIHAFCVVATDSAGNMEQKELDAEFELSNGVLGDANLDGSVNVNDITTIAKFILEGKVSPWSKINADANEDGTINVNDITKTAEIILLRAKAEMEAKAAMEAMQNKE